MKICVCGWHLEKYDDFYLSLARVNGRREMEYPVYVVSNRADKYLEIMDLPHHVRENTGLEWGAYNDYLMNIWDEKSDVLFCHDDIILHPLIVDHEIHPAEIIFDRTAELRCDHAYIFQNRKEDAEGYGMHGRMMYMSRKLLRMFKEKGGFWYDKSNQGHVGEYLSGGKGYNDGLAKFHEQLGEFAPALYLQTRVYMPNIEFAKRGRREEQKQAEG